jgi:hypothetical protein
MRVEPSGVMLPSVRRYELPAACFARRPAHTTLKTFHRLSVLKPEGARGMYRPNFCAECGERIVRARWRFWTSRRFCASCSRRFRKRRIFASVVLCAILFGLGFMVGRRGSTARPPLLVVERGGANVAPLHASGESQPKGEAGSEEVRATPQPAYGLDGTSGERPTDPSEVVSMCGARTQKGTPCQRRVRGTGRCWQHRGKAAMLPPSKLLVPG